jgi:spermidine/putrescine-binding protein
VPTAFTKGVAGAAGTFDNYVLLYSPEKVKPAPTSWKLLWDENTRTRSRWLHRPTSWASA